MLPIMTAVIIMIGIAISSQMTSQTSAALARVEKIQYPTVEALRVVRSELVDVQEFLQRGSCWAPKPVMPLAPSVACRKPMSR